MCEKDDRAIVRTKDGREVEITPEMEDAGASVVYDFFGDFVAYGSETAKAAASSVFRAMASKLL